MTAEVVIMNKSAVAMAADSAVTIGNGRKIYNSVNKLFSISRNHPVGIMIYGNGEFMHHPWESIIKEYIKSVDGKSHSTLKEYAFDFVQFIESRTDLFSENLQDEKFKSCTRGLLNHIKQRIDEKIKTLLESEDSIEDTAVSETTSSVISSEHAKLVGSNKLHAIPETHSQDLLNRYKTWINEEIVNIFQKLPLEPSSVGILVEMCAMIHCVDVFPFGKSGVVFSGFGESEIFPSTVAFDIESLTLNKLKYSIFASDSIDTKSDGSILPFAQEDVVRSFMEGFHPSYSKVLTGYLKQLFNSYPERLLETIPGIPDEQRKDILKKHKEIGQRMFEVFNERIDEFKHERHINPIMNAVAFLPKDELASMAETLINLTSFKRRISMEIETVGGPVDVAVISKGDGFVWIKRKRYFEMEPNSGFSRNFKDFSTL